MATLSADAYNRIMTQAAKQGISAEKVASTAASKWLTVAPAPSTIKTPTTTPTATPTQTGSLFRGWDTQARDTVAPISWIHTSQWEIIKDKPTSMTELPSNLNFFGQSASKMFGSDASKFDARDDILAKNIVASGQSVEDYLRSQKWFETATAQEQANTIKAITNRIWQFQTAPMESEVSVDMRWKMPDGSDALGYNKMSDFEKQQFDNLSDPEKRYIDWLMRKNLEEGIAYKQENTRQKEYMKKQRETTLKIQDLEGNIIEIQSSAKLRDARKSVDNLKQNYAYLWTMWAPWVSQVRIDAVAGHIADAELKFQEMKQIETQLAQIRELWLEMDTAGFEKQLADLAFQLDQNVDKAIQWALNDLSYADMKWELDTLDGINNYRRKMLENLDNSIQKYSTGTLNQIQAMTQIYTRQMEVAEAGIKEYQKNANIVNMEMSSLKGFYVDGNGAQILWANGQPIKAPPVSAFPPSYDPVNWTLTTFHYDENGQIRANHQQVHKGTGWEWKLDSKTGNYWRQWADGNLEFMTPQQFNKQFPAHNRESVIADMKQWMQSNMVRADDTEWVAKYVQNIADGTPWGQCWYAMNNISQALWLGKLFGNKKGDKTNQINSKEAKIWSFVVMDSKSSPEYWHVGMVVWIDWDNLIVKSSNYKWDGKRRTDTIAKDNELIKGYVDVTGELQPMTGAEDSWPMTMWWNAIDQLSMDQLTQANNLIVKLYWATAVRASTADAERLRNNIYEQFASGKTFDQVEDMMRYGTFGEWFQWDYWTAFDNIAMYSKMTDKVADTQRNRLEDTIDRYWAESPQAKQALQNIAKGSMDTETRKILLGNEEVKSFINTIEADLKAYEAKWGNTNILNGKAEDVAKKIWQVKDPELREIANKIQKSIQSYRQKVSWAAFTESEAKEYRAIFPSIENTGTLNAALINSLRQIIDVSIDSTYWQIMGTDTYEKMFKQTQSTQWGTTGWTFNSYKPR
jgi:hypothetical protein